jgi:hypothetical protein
MFSLMSPTGSRATIPAVGPIFATTHWTAVIIAADSATAGAQAALEDLCRTYWCPLYAFVRRKGYPPHEAEDLTQSFFAIFLEKRYLHDVAREGLF